MINIDRINGTYGDTANGERLRILFIGCGPEVSAKRKQGVNLWLNEIDPINDLRENVRHDPRRRRSLRKILPEAEQQKRTGRDHNKKGK